MNIGSIGGIFDAISSGLGSLLGIHNVFAQEEQKKYDRQLQERMFEREDNAVQRKMADLQKAGLNPILASGQGASAGPAVSAGSNRQVNSSMLQSMAFTNLENLRLQNKNASIANTAAMGSPDYLKGLLVKNTINKYTNKNGKVDFKKVKEDLSNLNEGFFNENKEFLEKYRTTESGKLLLNKPKREFRVGNLLTF